MEQLIERLTILRDSQVIVTEVFEKMLLFLNRLNNENLLDGSDSITMMITHIAMALQRQISLENIIEMDEDTKNEINLHPYKVQAQALWDYNQDIFEELPENEKYYILANFCNIMGGKK